MRGNQAALDRLTPLVYDELRLRARNYLRRERPDHTLQPTALIHEVYLRLVGDTLPEWQNRAHFFAIASRAMRQILVDHARRRGASKRGDGVADLSLDEVIELSESENSDLLALDEALAKLAAFDERKCRVVEMRYFGGCTVEERTRCSDSLPCLCSGTGGNLFRFQAPLNLAIGRIRPVAKIGKSQPSVLTVSPDR